MVDMSPYHIDKYAKEEAISAIMNSYINANLDITVTCIFKGCSLGSFAKPNAKLPIIDDKGSRLLDCISISYRMRYRNAPNADIHGINCMLSFGGVFTQTYVPYVNILVISLSNNMNFSINFPYLEVPESESESESESELEPVKHIKPKKKSFLRIVK